MNCVSEGKTNIYLNIYRNECYSNCVNDNFPQLTCEKEKLNLTYNGNVYDTFYFYPKVNTTKYQECLSYVDTND